MNATLSDCPWVGSEVQKLTEEIRGAHFASDSFNNSKTWRVLLSQLSSLREALTVCCAHVPWQDYHADQLELLSYLNRICMRLEEFDASWDAWAVIESEFFEFTEMLYDYEAAVAGLAESSLQ